jgi:GTPase SAR1 family protein
VLSFILRLAVIILVGNKSDLAEQREVTYESGQEYAER